MSGFESLDEVVIGSHTISIFPEAAVDGYTTGEITTWEQLGDWNIIELANNMGVYLDDGSIIKIWRKCTKLPPIDASSGWLSTDNYFGWESKIEKYFFGPYEYGGDFDSGDESNATQDPSTPVYTEGYEDWAAFFNDSGGLPTRYATGWEQYLDFYDYHNRTFGTPGEPGFTLGANIDRNQLLRYNRVDPQGGLSGDLSGAWPSHPYVDEEKTNNINDDLNNAYGSEQVYAAYFRPTLWDPAIPRDGDHDSDYTNVKYLSESGTYDEATAYITSYHYAYEALKAHIASRYITQPMVDATHEAFVVEAVEALATQKLSASSRFSQSRQRATKIPIRSLSSVLVGGVSPSATAVTETGTADTTTFTYDTESSDSYPY